MRITGMASGMDIDKMVSDLMKAERIPQNKLRQKKDLLSFQTSLYREVNTKMAALRSALNDIRYSSTMTGFKGTSSNSDVSVTSNSATAASSHTVEVQGLAASAVVTGNSGVTNFGLAGSNYLPAAIDSTNNKFVLTVDNSAKYITLPDGTYDDVQMKAELQKQIDMTFGSGKVTVDNTGGKLSFTPVTKGGYTPQVIVNEGNGAMNALGFSEGQSYRINLNQSLSDLAASGKMNTAIVIPGQFQVTGDSGSPVMINYDGTDSIQSIMNKVNSSSANMTMSYDANNDQFVFKSRKTGAAAEVTVSDNTGNFLSAIKVGNATQNGTDAAYTLDGASQTNATNTITTADGSVVTFNKITTAPVTISVASDPSAVVDKIKKFIASYNDMIDLVNTRLSEQTQRGFDPLTDEQKQDMKDSDIANWETKVKTGLLNKSPILKEIKTSLRELFSKDVAGIDDAYNTLSEVGITTVPYVVGVPRDAGKLQLDESKLLDAVSKNPDAVNKLFTNNPGYESQEGIAVTMYKKVDTMLSALMKQAGRVDGREDDITTSIGNQISTLQFKIKDFDDLLSKKEDNYYKRFTIMEQAVAKGNAQLSWLSQQLG